MDLFNELKDVPDPVGVYARMNEDLPMLVFDAFRCVKGQASLSSGRAFAAQYLDAFEAKLKGEEPQDLRSKEEAFKESIKQYVDLRNRRIQSALNALETVRDGAVHGEEMLLEFDSQIRRLRAGLV